MPRTLKISKGDIFGRLIIVKEEDPVLGKRRFLCKCTCKDKTNKIIGLRHLTSGKIVSCGCYVREVNTSHGLYNNKLYYVYKSMISRCYSKDTEAYPNYGGRGIKVCKEWCDKKNDRGLLNFIGWNSQLPLNKQWKPGLELDRRDNEGDYAPSNCRWVKCKVNVNNKRNNIVVNFKNKSYTFSDFYTKYGNSDLVTYKTALARIKLGWDCLKAVTTVTQKRKANVLKF